MRINAGHKAFRITVVTAESDDAPVWSSAGRCVPGFGNEFDINRHMDRSRLNYHQQPLPVPVVGMYGTIWLGTPVCASWRLVQILRRGFHPQVQRHRWIGHGDLAVRESNRLRRRFGRSDSWTFCAGTASNVEWSLSPCPPGGDSTSKSDWRRVWLVAAAVTSRPVLFWQLWLYVQQTLPSCVQ